MEDTSANGGACPPGIKVSGINRHRSEANRIHTYEEAIALAGNGWYNRSLLTILSIGLLGMGIDIFGFSVIVTGCSCDFQLNLTQKSIMMSMPFIGPIVMSYVWGYFSDTQGRKQCLLIGMIGSFLASFVSAFSPHWIVLAILKVISTSTCSAAQSTTYALLGESCSQAVRGFYMLIMTSVLMLFLLCYIVPGYFILNLNFALDLGLVTFTPWRLLAMVLAMPLGLCALGLRFFYESPKFLVNAGREDEALNNLGKIWERNGGAKDAYPVAKVNLNEDNNVRKKDVAIVQSLMDQTFPLFRPPLIWKTVQLFHLTAVIYVVNNSLVMWFPSIVEAFAAGINTASEDSPNSLCDIIIDMQNRNGTDVLVQCSSVIEKRTLLSGIFHGILFSGITLGVSKLASRKKLLMIGFLFIPMMSALVAIYNENEVASLGLFVGMMMTNLCMGVLFAYYVDLYPTSHRGMAACLGVMVARISGLTGVQFLGHFVMSHCHITFYTIAACLLSGVASAVFLPNDKPKKEL